MADVERTPRLVEVDRLRGLLIVLMAFDHARYFLLREHSAEWWGGELPRYDSLATFLERAISHFCAPGFFFLMGVSMALFARKHESRGRRQIAVHFLLRGALLTALELVLISPVWLMGSWGVESFTSYDSPAPPGSAGAINYYFGVISALGAAMMISSALIWIASRWLAMLSVVAMLLPSFSLWSGLSPPDDHGLLTRFLWIAGQKGGVLVQYPILPWLGVVALGILYGREASARRFKALSRSLVIAAAALIVFLTAALLGSQWVEFGHYAPSTVWGIFNLTKYPPSPGYLATYLGGAILLLHAFRMTGRAKSVLRWLDVYGAEPFVAYVAHLYILLLAGFVLPQDRLSFICGYAGALAIVWMLCREYRRRHRSFELAMPSFNR